ncbi:cupin domain-containing protein [Phototrophicus methaneseepsis]|uniref:Cupin domain-containing protein n=1 Tax=Phototrophicus methaneseepsis TaxID=2710758 RepID=A0A7S8E6I3_9CHLR|nr:cupin domain-containing protein [Phototrophicus methaneseepsis]QPC81287.1 cupin domain-containing protein [Phototrophicus methaneseepsis]
MPEDKIQTFTFTDDGKIPNNPDLPLVVYRQALSESSDHVDACQRLFSKHNWRGIWVNGIYSYHHYHSTSHEVLGIVEGNAEVQFGGEEGESVQVYAGDVVVIPAGVGHCRLHASNDFRVVGAYPAGQENWDLQTGKPDERPQVLENIQAVPLPEQDPVFGNTGPLLDAWKKTS